MEFLFEILFQFFGELLLQVLFEAVAELGFRALADPFKKRRNPILSALGFLIWGTIAGGLSLLVMPHSAIADPLLRKINIAVTPLLIGLIMAMVGNARLKRGQELVSLDKFAYAYVFALAMAIVRFCWAT